MAFEHASVTKMREFATRASARLQNIKKASEKALHQGFQIVEVNGSLFGWGYANARWGKAPDNDATGAKELSVFGVPADLGVGIALLGVSMFGGMGIYAEHGINLGIGSTGAFSYRFGTELGNKAAASDSSTTTSGSRQMGVGAARVGPNGGRVHSVHYR